jgi:hypothetical protein
MAKPFHGPLEPSGILEEKKMSQPTEVFEERFHRLERAHRIQKAITVVAFAVMVAIVRVPSLTAVTSGPKVFSAQSFVLTDASNRTLAVLGPVTGGGAALTFVDHNGARVESVGALDSPHLFGLGIYDGNTLNPKVFGGGILRLVVGVGDSTLPISGYGAHEFDDLGGNTISWGSNIHGGDPHFATYRSGAIRTYTGVASGGDYTASWLYDEKGNTRAGFNIDVPNNFVGAFVNDPGNINRVLLGTQKFVNPVAFVNVSDPHQQLRAQLLTYDNGASGAEAMLLLDQNGVFRSGLQVDNTCCGLDAQNDSLFFFNPDNYLTGSFYSALGGGTFFTNDGTAAGTVTGHLP